MAKIYLSGIVMTFFLFSCYNVVSPANEASEDMGLPDIEVNNGRLVFATRNDLTETLEYARNNGLSILKS